MFFTLSLYEGNISFHRAHHDGRAQLIRWWKVPLINFTRAFSTSCWGFVLLRKSLFNILKWKSTFNVDVLTITGSEGWKKCFDKMITGAWRQTLHVQVICVYNGKSKILIINRRLTEGERKWLEENRNERDRKRIISSKQTVIKRINSVFFSLAKTMYFLSLFQTVVCSSGSWGLS